MLTIFLTFFFVALYAQDDGSAKGRLINTAKKQAKEFWDRKLSPLLPEDRKISRTQLLPGRFKV